MTVGKPIPVGLVWCHFGEVLMRPSIGFIDNEDYQYCGSDPVRSCVRLFGLYRKHLEPRDGRLEF